MKGLIKQTYDCSLSNQSPPLCTERQLKKPSRRVAKCLQNFLFYFNLGQRDGEGSKELTCDSTSQATDLPHQAIYIYYIYNLTCSLQPFCDKTNLSAPQVSGPLSMTHACIKMRRYGSWCDALLIHKSCSTASALIT